MIYKDAFTNSVSEKLELFSKSDEELDRDHCGNTQLHLCRSMNDAQDLINAGIDVNVRNDDQETPLMTNDDLEVCQFLLEHGAQIDAVDEDGNTALLKAQSTKKQLFLIHAGADINAKNSDGRTLLMNPRLEFDVASLAVEKGADVNACDVDQKTPLMFARDLETAKLYIGQGANVNAIDIYGNTPIMYARTPQIFRLLINSGAKYNCRNKDNITPLMKFHNNYELVDLLLDMGTKTSLTNHLGENVLFDIKNTQSLRRLVSAGANVNRKSLLGRTPIMTAKSREIMEAMIELGADITICDKDGNSLLKTANIECFDVLLSAGLNPKHINKHGQTLLMLVKDMEIVKKLIDLGVNVNAVDQSGNNALAYANNKTAPILIEAGCNVNNENHLGQTPLMCHADDRTDAVLKQLIEAGANINKTDKNGNNVLFYSHNAVSMKYLIEAGAEVNISNLQGMTPLHVAATTNFDCTKELIEHGSDIHAKDFQGHTPYQDAFKLRDFCSSSILNYLNDIINSSQAVGK